MKSKSSIAIRLLPFLIALILFLLSEFHRELHLYIRSEKIGVACMAFALPIIYPMDELQLYPHIASRFFEQLFEIFLFFVLPAVFYSSVLYVLQWQLARRKLKRT